MTAAPWSGHRVTKARAYMATRLPAPCGRCGRPVTPQDEWVIGHIKDRITHPQLVWTVANWRHEHKACSDRTGQAAVIAKARQDALRSYGITEPDFPRDTDPEEPPPLPVSLPLGIPHRPRITNQSKAAPAAISREPLEIREELQWNPERLRAYPWLREFADVPADASPPLAMTPPHPEAVGSYGAQIIEWAEREHKITLRWWQRLAIVRQHEHRDDGGLCWAEMTESASRRSGKSVRIRAVATWRLAHADLIGEPQAVVHCGNDLPICRDVQKKAWRWAENLWGRDSVTKGNGKEAIENPNDGSHWIVKAQDAAYGYDANLAVVDEAWDVKPDTVTEGLEPMLLERLWAQLHITSTAHRRARSIMKSKISGPLAEDDDRTLLLLWGALPQDDPGDPETWRKASPHWSEDRRRMLAAKYEKALLGEADPQADDPDPLEGFRAQYLNVWSLSTAPQARGAAIVDRAAWVELTVAAPTRRPDSCAIESWFDAGASVAFGWRLEDGAAAVRVIDVPDLAAAAEAIAAAGFAGKVTVGASLVADPAFAKIRVTSGKGRGIQAVLELSRLLAEGQLVHTNAPGLTTQVLAVRTVSGADGPRLASHGRTDAIKAATWAATAARKPGKGKVRIITAA